MNAQWLIAALPALPLGLTLWNVGTWKRPRPTFCPAATPRVSVLIPARNEEQAIGAALDCVLVGQPELLEVLVLDDESTDRTAAIVQERMKSDPRVRLLTGRTLPRGWVGKPHACHQLAEAAQGDTLLFVDADVRLRPGAIGGLLSLHETPDASAGAGVVTAVPRQLTGSLAERLILPLLHLTYCAWLPLNLIETTRSPTVVAANGQLLLVGRSAYARMGGFEAVKEALVDDVSFCRRAKSQGIRVCFADGYALADCRMYRGARQVWAGFSKNLYAGIGASPGMLLFVLALYLGCFVAPYVLMVAGLVALPSLGGAALLAVIENVALRAALAVRYRQPASGLLLHPLAVLFLAVIAVNSALTAARGRVIWAGRTYSGHGPRTAKAVTLGASRRSDWFMRMVRPYVRYRLRGAFESVSVSGLDGLKAAVATQPLLIAANHVAWWDPLLLLALDEALGTRSHFVMDAKGLRELPFFRWAGAVPLERERPRQCHRDLLLASQTARCPGELLVIFPQGEQQPAHLELKLGRGVEWLARRTGMAVVPLAIRYDFGDGPRLQARLSLGKPIAPAECLGGSFLATLTRALERELKRIEQAVTVRESALELGSFVPLWPSRASGRMPLPSRVLSWLIRGCS